MTTLYISIDGIPGFYGYGGTDLALDGYEPAGLASMPLFSADSIDPQSGDFTGSRCSIAINASAASRSRFLFQQTSVQATLSTTVTDAETTFLLASPGIAGTPDVFYIGSEAVSVAKVNDTQFTVARGQYNTLASAHLAGALIFTAPTYWRRRVVRVFYEGEARWVGYLDKAPRTSPEGNIIELEAALALALGDDLKVGDTRTAIDVGPQEFSARFASTLAFTVNDDPTGQNSVAGSLLAIAPVRNGNSLTPAYLYSGRGDVWEVPSIELIGSPDVADQEARKIIPVLALGGDFERAALVGPLHILEVAANLLFSDGSQPATYDPVAFNLFPAAWSARLGWATDGAALANIRALMAADPTATCDRFILGWDGAPVSVIPAVVQLLRLCGYVLATTPSGALTFKRLLPANVLSTLNDAQPQRDTVLFQNPEVGAIDQVIATYGKTPWDPGATITTSIAGFDSARGESTELNLAHLNVTRAGIEGAAYVLSMTLSRWRGSPLLDILATGCEEICIGDYVRLLRHLTLETALFPLNDGSFTNDVEQGSFVGQVISRRWLPETGAHELTLLLNSWAVGGLLKVRAPALVVEAIAAPGVIDTVANPGWGVPTDVGVDWPSYPVPVEVWTADGEVRTATCGVGVASGWLAGSLTMSTLFTVNPDPGDVIRIARGAEGYLVTDPRNYVILDAGDRYS